jgi:hypothetical protein
MLIIGFIYGFFTMFLPEFLVSKSYPLYTGLSWTDFKLADPVLANYILILLRFSGGGALASALGGVIVIFNAYRKVEKWAWYYVLVVSIIVWGNTLIGNIAYKNPVTITICIVGLLLVAVALIISAKDFLGEKKG